LQKLILTLNHYANYFTKFAYQQFSCFSYRTVHTDFYIYIYYMYRKMSENGTVVYRYTTEGTSLAAYSNQINCMYHTVSSSVTNHDVGLAHASQPLPLHVSFPQPVTQDVPHQNTIQAYQCCQSDKQST